jgi:CBS domain containing-hemolysin-like protein
MIQLLVAVVFILLSSGLCSGTEAALFSVALLKVRRFANAPVPSKSAVALLTIREKMNRPITTIVILNNLANIGGSILVGHLATEVLGNQWLGLFSGVLTFLVIIFSEIIPKTIGESYAETIALFMARPVLAITRLLTPIAWAVEKITAPFIRQSPRYTTNEAEIKILAKIGQREGVIEQDESDMIQRIFDLNDLTAADLMTPRVTMTYLKGDALLSEVKDTIMDSQHSRIVVVHETPDEVIGMVLKEELLAAMIENKTETSIKHFLHEVHFVPELKRADSLLPVFQKTHQHLAVVVDEYGGVAGVVTLEDVLEVLTGEIVDETDQITDLQEFARRRKRKTFTS